MNSNSNSNSNGNSDGNGSGNSGGNSFTDDLMHLLMKYADSDRFDETVALVEDLLQSDNVAEVQAKINTHKIDRIKSAIVEAVGKMDAEYRSINEQFSTSKGFIDAGGLINAARKFNELQYRLRDHLVFDEVLGAICQENAENGWTYSTPNDDDHGVKAAGGDDDAQGDEHVQDDEATQ